MTTAYLDSLVCTTLCVYRECRVLRELVYCCSTVLEPDTRAILMAECSPRLRISDAPLLPVDFWGELVSEAGDSDFDSEDEDYYGYDDYDPDYGSYNPCLGEIEKELLKFMF